MFHGNVISFNDRAFTSFKSDLLSPRVENIFFVHCVVHINNKNTVSVTFLRRKHNILKLSYFYLSFIVISLGKVSVTAVTCILQIYINVNVYTLNLVQLSQLVS